MTSEEQQGKEAEGAAPETGRRAVLQRLRHDLETLKSAFVTELHHAVELACAHAGERGTHDQEELRRLETRLSGQMGELRQRFEEEGYRLRSLPGPSGVESLPEAGDRSLAALQGIASSLRSLAEMVEASARELRPYEVGEVVRGGSFACRRCGNMVHLAYGATIAPCPGCGGRSFRWI